MEPLEAESVDETTGLNAAETFLQQEPDLAMLIGINDAGALGAYQAFQEAIANGRDPESIFVGGMDGQTEALELIADGGGEGGIYRASGALILDDLGRAVADLPADLIEGKDVSVLELPYELGDPGRHGAGPGDRRHLQLVHRRRQRRHVGRRDRRRGDRCCRLRGLIGAHVRRDRRLSERGRAGSTR